jgi:glycosyltransferase involved in cell wall biosynthesis
MRNNISVVLATHNEEKNLPKCLDSVRDLTDEIIVVDGSSTDKTVQIARKYGAKVIVTENLPNFHINKQKAIELATKDWILQLDADERVSPELREEIKKSIENCPLRREASKLKNENCLNGYWMPRKNWFLGRFLMKGGQYPDYTLRLYRRGKGRLPQVHVHEQAEVVGKVGYLNHALLHYPYENFASYLEKWNRYNSLLASQIKEKVKNRSFFIRPVYAVGYLIVKPAHWFLTTYIRHKGFMDSWPGFIFSLFSALRFPVSYIKYLNL